MYECVCVCECVQLLCVCMFSSLFVCLCVCSCPVRSFVAGAINSPQVLCSCCALICWYTWSVISLYAYSACCREILTLSMRCSLLLNTSRAFTYQVSDVKGKFISAFTPRWCGNCTPLGQRLGEEALNRERTEWAARRWSWPSHFDAYVAQKYWPGL